MKEQIEIVRTAPRNPRRPTYSNDDFEVLNYEELEPQESFWKLTGNLLFSLGLAAGELAVMILKSATIGLTNRHTNRHRRRYLSSIARQEPEYWRMTQQPISTPRKPVKQRKSKAKRKITITVEIEE